MTLRVQLLWMFCWETCLSSNLDVHIGQVDSLSKLFVLSNLLNSFKMFHYVFLIKLLQKDWFIKPDKVGAHVNNVCSISGENYGIFYKRGSETAFRHVVEKVIQSSTCICMFQAWCCISDSALLEPCLMAGQWITPDPVAII